MTSFISAANSSPGDFADLNVAAWHWGVLLIAIAAMLMVDLLVIHREAHVVETREAAIESAVWISLGVAFTFVMWWWFGAQASGEYITGYLIEKSLSIDNVFVWALIMASFKVPQKFQHRVLFWGIFGALVMRAVFIFAGVALIERFEWVLYLFGGFLIFTGIRLFFFSDDESNPAEGFFGRLIARAIPTTDRLDGQKLFTIENGKRLATPLFVVLLLVEITDVLFAVDSVPAVLAVSHEPFLVFSSNAFAILGLRALYFLLADLHNRFVYLNEGLAIILVFVGIKMLLLIRDVHIPTAWSLALIAVVLAGAIGVSWFTSSDDDNDHVGSH